MQKTLLLCTFTNVTDKQDIVDKIKTTYELAFNSIYVLKNTDNEDQLILTYNIIGDFGAVHKAPAYTISVHRKKQTNTIYTINAINMLMMERIGRVDPQYKIDWEDLENTVLVTAYGKLKRINTQILEIIKID